MSTDHISHATIEPTDQRAGTLFYGKLTKKRLMSLPGHFFLISNVGSGPWVPALEAEVTDNTSRQELWGLIVGRRLNGRTFRILRDRESLQAEKDKWLRAALCSTAVQ